MLWLPEVPHSLDAVTDSAVPIAPDPFGAHSLKEDFLIFHYMITPDHSFPFLGSTLLQPPHLIEIKTLWVLIICLPLDTQLTQFGIPGFFIESPVWIVEHRPAHPPLQNNDVIYTPSFPRVRLNM